MIVAPGLHRPPHPLRRAALLGSVPDALRLARRHVGRDRQLRLRLRADAPRDARAGDAHDDAGRGDPVRVDAPRPALGLGHLPRVPRQRRPAPEGGQRAALRARGAAARLGAGLRARQGRRDAHRRGASRAAPPAARGDGRRRVRLVGAAAPSRRPRRRAARLRRRPDGHRRHARRDGARARRGARRAQPGLHADGARDGGRQRTTSLHHRGAGSGERPAAPLQRRPVVRSPSRGAPRADRVARLVPAARPPGVRAGRHHHGGVHLHLRGLEPVRRRRGVGRGDPGHAGGAQAEARRPRTPGAAARLRVGHRHRPHPADHRPRMLQRRRRGRSRT